jgi:hypothetical protein
MALGEFDGPAWVVGFCGSGLFGASGGGFAARAPVVALGSIGGGFGNGFANGVGAGAGPGMTGIGAIGFAT